MREWETAGYFVGRDNGRGLQNKIERQQINEQVKPQELQRCRVIPGTFPLNPPPFVLYQNVIGQCHSFCVRFEFSDVFV